MIEILRRINGLFVGQLDDDELRVFEWAIAQGLARRDYDHPSGFFLGVPKVKML